MEHRVTENVFAEWLESLAEFRAWLITIFLFTLAAGAAYILLVPPVYLSDALLQIEEKERGMSGLGETTEILQQDAIVSEKAKIVTSRSVLGRAVDSLALDIVAQPVYMPVIGRALARWNAGGEIVREPWKIISRYAWGGETISLSLFEVPENYYDKPFILVAEGEGGYGLYDENDQPLGSGKAGAQSVFHLPGGGNITLLVASLDAHSGTNFKMRRLSRLAAIEHLREKIKVEESVRGPNAPLKSGLLRISLEGPDAKAAAATVDTIVNTFIAQSQNYKSEDIVKTLDFVKEQLSVVQARMQQAEKALSNFQHRHGLVDLPREANTLLDRVAGIEASIADLQRNREEMSLNFTESHYRIAAIDAQIAALEGEREALTQRMQQLPDMQQELVSLSRDVQVNQHLYTLLLSKSHELQVLKAGATGDVRVLDSAAVPIKPVRPKKGFVAMLSVVLGLLLGTGAAMLRRRLFEVVRDPDLVEHQIGLPVVAVVPNSRRQSRLNKGINKRAPAVLARVETQDIAVESLRSLRTVLNLNRPQGDNKVILVTGPAPNVGKSFVAMNLAAVLAGAGKTVLLVDADFRRGQINKMMRLDNGPGLSDLLSGKSSMDAPVRLTQIPNLDVLPAGTRPPNPSELLMQPRFEEVIGELSQHYDFVIIDSPPILAVTDAAIIAKLATTVLLVVKAGSHHMREIEQSVKFLNRAGVTPDGIVFNGMKFSKSGYGYGRYYGYAYASSMKK